jgi:spore maturation protein CgeB
MNMFIDYVYQLNTEDNHIHEILEIYCSNCGGIDIEDTNNSCANCYDSDLYFICGNCTEIIKLEDFYDLCPELIEDNIIKIQRFYKKRIFIKKLINYRNSLLELYFHPNSVYIQYYINHFNTENKRKQIAYINNNKLKILKIE